MTQLQKVTGKSTAIYRDTEGIHVKYHSTRVVSLSVDGMVTLRSGGYRTFTTKVRMNQASNQFDLGFTVWQKNFNWFVDLPDGSTRPFVEGMTFEAA